MSQNSGKVLTFNLDAIIKCEEVFSPSPLLINKDGIKKFENINNSATTDAARISEFGSIQSSPDLDERTSTMEQP